jgi:hypothetical protein
MSMPGFTATSSIYRSTDSYQTDGVAEPFDGAIQPAWVRRWGIGCETLCQILSQWECRRTCPPFSIDCLPMCMIFSQARCRRLCHRRFYPL